MSSTLRGTIPLRLRGATPPDDTAFASPDGDVSAGGWTDQDDGTTNLYSVLDEPIADESDYVKSSEAPVADALLLELAPLGDPVVDTGHRLSYRYAKTGSGTIDLTARLYDGVTQIAEWTHTDIGVGSVTAHQELTEAEAAAISNYGDLRVEFEAN